MRAVRALVANRRRATTHGYDVRLIESSGRGHEVFADLIAKAERSMVVAVVGEEDPPPL